MFVCRVVSSAVILAFLRVADPAACQGKAGVVLYILQVSPEKHDIHTLSSFTCLWACIFS